MQVKVKLFGAFRKYGNGTEILLDWEGPAQISSLRVALEKRLKELHPEFREAALIGESAFANESRILNDQETIQDGCSLAVLPPVCGG